jgi:hypothetical protein
MRSTPHVLFTGRKFGVWVCLLAVLLLWTPLWAAAWQANGMACCADGLCPAHGHANVAQSEPQRAAAEEPPGDCEHHGKNASHSELTKCSVSCCRETTTPFTAGVVFVLPHAAVLSQPSPIVILSVRVSTSEFDWSIEPLSPPPRLCRFSA